MSWVKIDDKAWAHPKLTGLSGNATRLWLFALCWCNQQETDGEIPKSVLRLLGGSAKDVTELTGAGLWHVTAAGWAIHDYLEYQPSAAQMRDERSKRSEAGRLGGRKSGDTRRSKTEASASHVLRRDDTKIEAGASINDAKNEALASPLLQINRTPVPSRPVPARPAEESTFAQSSTSSTPKEASPGVLGIPLAGGGEHVVTASDLEEWAAAYPGVDVIQSLRSCRQWNLADPRRQKTAKGVRRHIVGWLTRDQDKGSARGGSLPPVRDHRVGYHPGIAPDKFYNGEINLDEI